MNLNQRTVDRTIERLTIAIEEIKALLCYREKSLIGELLEVSNAPGSAVAHEKPQEEIQLCLKNLSHVLGKFYGVPEKEKE